MRVNRRLLIAGLAAMAFASKSHARETDLDAVVQAVLLETDAPALTGAVVDRGGVRKVGCAGLRMLGAPDKVSRDDRWHIGSNAKAMTAALHARLVEAGVARWDMAIPSLFPDLTLDPAWSAITIDHLLSHTGGVADRAVMRPEFMAAARTDSRALPVQRTELARRVLEKPPAGTTGEMVYSNVGYAIAGAAIERLTNLAWEDAMRAFIFKPLGMASAGFGAPDGNNPRGHRRVPPQFATLTPADVGVMSDNAAVTRPAGGMHMSIADYGRFLAIFLGGSPNFLSKTSLARLTTPRASNERPYALGWGIRAHDEWARGPLLSHEGSNSLWHAVVALAPARGLGLIALANAGPKLTLTLAAPQPGDTPGTRRFTGSSSATPGPARRLLERLKVEG